MPGAGRRPKIRSGDIGSREAILTSARRIFARRGFAGTSTRDVAADAGVNNAMIYYHFRDKVTLYRAVLAASFDEFDRLWDHPVFSSRQSCRKKIRTYVEGFISFQQANEELRRIMTMEFACCSQNYAWLADTYFGHSYRRLANLLEEGMRSGELRRIDPSLAIPGLVGMIIHSFIMRPMAEHIMGKKLDLDRKRFGRFVTGMFFDGLGRQTKE
jgi:AcrR family transcriptional regulator